MRRLRVATLMALLPLVLSGLVAGCGDDDDGDDDPTAPTAADLAGSYELVSFKFESQPTLSPPLATGTLDLTPSQYQVHISIDVVGNETTIDDMGTYQVSSDGTWTQESTVMGVQSVGTFELQNDTLSVDVTTQGQRILNVWHRTG